MHTPCSVDTALRGCAAARVGALHNPTKNTPRFVGPCSFIAPPRLLVFLLPLFLPQTLSC
jgi:hypothetical protein